MRAAPPRASVANPCRPDLSPPQHSASSGRDPADAGVAREVALVGEPIAGVVEGLSRRTRHGHRPNLCRPSTRGCSAA